MFNTQGIELGDRAKDRISGFSGIAIAITFWLNGCVRVTIQPEELPKDGKLGENYTFDVEQCEVTDKSVIEGPKIQHGGPSISPTQRTDPKRI